VSVHITFIYFSVILSRFVARYTVVCKML